MFSLDSKSKLDKLISYLLIVLMALMVVNVTWQVASRYIFKDPSSFTDELSRYMMIWVGMLGAAYVAGKNDHLAIDILLTSLKGKAQDKLMILISVCILVFAVIVMVIGGSNLVYITFILSQKSATLQIPLAYVYSIIPFSGVLITYYQLFFIIQLSTSIKTAE
ncbi:TRAP-type C4-dicarboxylate transport system permease small subunit [Algoriphagus iocasae]|jgi:TRAP-type C4-dicarboxylate transport system permease small subunit|uniref:TRAP-type C4-dicarboxylate transport system permease small subunit n=1 Tax=Algoriphagus iocasae TaxID=1836499 RepID=A0A841MBC2_9BACT|nr:TRAP transporter small permease [Algoriphagus iocasae]MBB6324610.1 TRAP-type C4-dicarboxylate transport system permease small subunit [Algoriphagus iocasae]